MRRMARSSTRLEANKSDASNDAFLTNKCPEPFVYFVLTLRQGTKGQLSVTTPLVGVARIGYSSDAHLPRLFIFIARILSNLMHATTRAPNTSAHDFPLLPMYYYRSFDLDRSTLTRLSPDKRWKSVGDVDVMRSECFFRQYFNAIRGLCLTIDIRYRIDSMHNLRLFFFFLSFFRTDEFGDDSR